MAAYTELDSGENDKQHSQKFRIKQVNQEFYFHSWENMLAGQQMTMVKKVKISTWLSFEVILMKALHRYVFV